MDGVEIKNVMASTLDGGQHRGLVAHVRNSTVTLTVDGGTSIHDFGKSGTYFTAWGSSGSLTVNMSNSTVTGAGATTALAQNGIQIEDGAKGTISNNNVSSVGWIGSGWTSTGILDAYADGVTYSGNTVSDAQSGIVILGDATATLNGKHNQCQHAGRPDAGRRNRAPGRSGRDVLWH